MVYQGDGHALPEEDDSVAQVVTTCVEHVRSGMSAEDIPKLQERLRQSYPEREQFDDFRVRVGNYLLLHPHVIADRDIRVDLVNVMFGEKFGDTFQNVLILCNAMGLAPTRYNLHGILYVWRKFVGMAYTNGLPEMSADVLKTAMRASRKLAQFLLSSTDLGVREDIFVGQEMTAYRELIQDISGEPMSPRQLRAGTLRFLAGRLRDEARDAGGFSHILEKKADEYEAEADGLGDVTHHYPRFIPTAHIFEVPVKKETQQVIVEPEIKKEVAMFQRSTTFVEEDQEGTLSWIDQVRQRREMEAAQHQVVSVQKVELPPRAEFVVSVKEQQEYRKEERRQKALTRFLDGLELDYKQKRIEKSAYNVATTLVSAVRDTPPAEKQQRHDLLDAAYIKDCISDAQYKTLCAILFG